MTMTKPYVKTASVRTYSSASAALFQRNFAAYDDGDEDVSNPLPRLGQDNVRLLTF